jgi:CRP-like cAMP-binding protein
MLAVLPEERLRALVAAGSAVRLEPGAQLFQEGDGADAVFVVISGEMDVGVTGEDGRDVWLARLGPGALIGEMGVLDGGPRSADVHAVRRSVLWRIGRGHVLHMLREEPSSALELLAMMAARLRTADVLVRETALLGLGGRLARLLLESESAAVTLSQGEMARLIGASRERVNRKLAAWRADGWVEVGTFGVKVVNRRALELEASPGPAI